MWLFVENNKEYCSSVKPEWDITYQNYSCLEEMADGNYWDVRVSMPDGSIEKLTGLDKLLIIDPFEYI